MILADTSIWIEFLRRNLSIFSLFKGQLEKNQIITVEWIFGELFQGAKNKKERDILENYWLHLPKIEESRIWIEAGKLAGEEKLPSRGIGLIDAAIITAARKRSAKIWTLDKRLKSILKSSEIHESI